MSLEELGAKKAFVLGLKLHSKGHSIGGGGGLAIDSSGAVAIVSSEPNVGTEYVLTSYKDGGNHSWIKSEYLSFWNSIMSQSELTYSVGDFVVNSMALCGVMITLKNGLVIYFGIRTDGGGYYSYFSDQGELWTQGYYSYICKGSTIKMAQGPTRSNFGGYYTTDYATTYKTPLTPKIAASTLYIYHSSVYSDGECFLSVVDTNNVAWINGVPYDSDYVALGQSTNATIIASGTNYSSHMHYSLNFIVNPSSFEYCEHFNVYKSYLSTGVAIESIVPLVALTYVSTFFKTIDFKNSQAYDCIKIANNAFVVLGLTAMPDLTALSYIVTEGG